jgi:hypothetical protein
LCAGGADIIFVQQHWQGIIPTLRLNPAFAQTPIIVLDTRDWKAGYASRERHIKLGADAVLYITITEKSFLDVLGEFSPDKPSGGTEETRPGFEPVPSAGSSDNTNESKSDGGKLREIPAQEPKQTGSIDAVELSVVIYVQSDCDRKLLGSILTAHGIKHEAVHDPEAFLARMSQSPRSLGFIHAAGDCWVAANRMKDDPTLAAKPLLVFNSYGTGSVAEYLGGEARAVFDMGYPFSIGAVLQKIDQYR